LGRRRKIALIKIIKNLYLLKIIITIFSHWCHLISLNHDPTCWWKFWQKCQSLRHTKIFPLLKNQHAIHNCHPVTILFQTTPSSANYYNDSSNPDCATSSSRLSTFLKLSQHIDSLHSTETAMLKITKLLRIAEKPDSGEIGFPWVWLSTRPYYS